MAWEKLFRLIFMRPHAQKVKNKLKPGWWVYDSRRSHLEHREAAEKAYEIGGREAFLVINDSLHEPQTTSFFYLVTCEVWQFSFENLPKDLQSCKKIWQRKLLSETKDWTRQMGGQDLNLLSSAEWIA